MIITTQRTRAGYFLDVLLTALGWLIFFLLFIVGIVAIIRAEMQGPDAPFLPPLLLSSIHTLLSYMVIVVAFAIILMLWAKYNQYRSAGKNRRKPPSPLTRERLCASFSVSDRQIDEMQGERVLRVEHAGDGAILAIQPLDVASRAAGPALVAPAVSQVVAAADVRDVAAEPRDFWNRAREFWNRQRVLDNDDSVELLPGVNPLGA